MFSFLSSSLTPEIDAVITKFNGLINSANFHTESFQKFMNTVQQLIISGAPDQNSRIFGIFIALSHILADSNGFVYQLHQAIEDLKDIHERAKAYFQHQQDLDVVYKIYLHAQLKYDVTLKNRKETDYPSILANEEARTARLEAAIAYKEKLIFYNQYYKNFQKFRLRRIQSFFLRYGRAIEMKASKEIEVYNAIFEIFKNMNDPPTQASTITPEPGIELPVDSKPETKSNVDDLKPDIEIAVDDTQSNPVQNDQSQKKRARGRRRGAGRRGTNRSLQSNSRYLSDTPNGEIELEGFLYDSTENNEADDNENQPNMDDNQVPLFKFDEDDSDFELQEINPSND